MLHHYQCEYQLLQDIVVVISRPALFTVQVNNGFSMFTCFPKICSISQMENSREFRPTDADARGEENPPSDAPYGDDEVFQLFHHSAPFSSVRILAAIGVGKSFGKALEPRSVEPPRSNHPGVSEGCEWKCKSENQG